MWHSFKEKQKGFTIVELLVTLGIMVTITSVVLSNQSVYTDGAALSNLAEEMSITLSQAQSYGIAVKELTPGSSDFSSAYGITASLLASGSSQAYLFFADRNSNQAYDGSWDCAVGGASECLERVDFTHSNYIEEICVVRTNGVDQCNVASRVDISFLRPNTEAQITFYNSSGNLYDPPNLKGVRIVLMSPAGRSNSVVVYSSGQISTE